MTLLSTQVVLAVDANQILKNVDEIRLPSGDVEFDVEIVDFKGNKQLRSTLYAVKSRGNESTLVDTVAPERQKGRKLLMLKDNLWFYTPDIKRSTRVSLNQKLTGEVANGDLAKVSFFEDYSASILGEEKKANKEMYKLELKAKSSSTTYPRIVLWVEKSNNRPVQAQYFALSGKKLKMGVFTNYQPNDGVVRPTTFIITDSLDPAKKSEMRYSKIRKSSLSDAIFSKENLQ